MERGGSVNLHQCISSLTLASPPSDVKQVPSNNTPFCGVRPPFPFNIPPHTSIDMSPVSPGSEGGAFPPLDPLASDSI